MNDAALDNFNKQIKDSIWAVEVVEPGNQMDAKAMADAVLADATA